MIQANNTTSIDETDGLPMPRRIWAVVSIESLLTSGNS